MSDISGKVSLRCGVSRVGQDPLDLGGSALRCAGHTNIRRVFAVAFMNNYKVCRALSSVWLVFGFLLLSEPVSYGDTLGRLSTDETELLMLKRALAEQDRRITALENALRVQQSGVTQAPRGNAAPSATLGDPSRPWTVSANWDRLKDGMSQGQVTAILGEPMSIEDIGDGFRTLFYRGDVPRSGSVSGNVKLEDERVWQVNKPVF